MSQKTSSCVREAVENIEDLQNAVEEDCPTGCHSKLASRSWSNDENAGPKYIF